ncbi:ribonuclease P protein component 2 [Candidatus Woesearchaeota archaeon]|nr:ribonuclease P protein component 2 [Candidatus Woesearchaeota archaeon]
MKIKPMLPSLKEKKRYISFEIVSKEKFSADETAEAVNSSVLELLGTLETGKAGILFLKDKFQNNAGVVKTGHRYVDKVRTALALIKNIDNRDVVFRTRIVSGTLKKAINKFNEIKRTER